MADKPGTYYPPDPSGYDRADPRNSIIKYEDTMGVLRKALDHNNKNRLFEGNAGYQYATPEEALRALNDGHWTWMYPADLSVFEKTADAAGKIGEDSPYVQTLEQIKKTLTGQTDKAVALVEEGAKRVETSIKQPGPYSNPLFDPRILNQWHPEFAGGGGRLFRGYIRQAPEYYDKIGGAFRGYGCRFLYNPSSYTVSYNTNNSVYPATFLNNLQSTAKLLIPNMQTMSFELLFDRMYEMVDQGYITRKGSGRNPEYELGVYADIRALERVCGIIDGEGPILPIPMEMAFGSEDILAGPNAPTYGGKPMKFYGRITEFSVAYSHFTYNMTPVRAGVTLTWMQQVRSRIAEVEAYEDIDNSTLTGIEEEGEE